MLLNYIDNHDKWVDFLNSKIFSLYSYRKEKRFLENYISNKKYLDLALDIKNNNYTFSNPIKMIINKGNSNKKRVVYKFNTDEVIILKYITFLLCDYDYLFSNNLYSFRKSTGIKDAIYKIKSIVKDKRFFGYKVDISNYFNSIDCNILLNRLKNDIDENLYLLIKNILSNKKCIYNDEIIFEDKGIIAGCPISSFLANYYLKDLDKYFYENNVYYFRYADDILILCEDKDSLNNYVKIIKDKINELKLCINSDKEYYYDETDKIDFLGFSFYDDSIDISTNTLNKAKRRIKRCARYTRKLYLSNELSYDDAIVFMIKKINKKFYGNKRSELSWKYWFFPVINSLNGLREIDKYFQDNIRYMICGKHNKKNYKIVPYSKLKENGYKSLVHEYYNFIKETK